MATEAELGKRWAATIRARGGWAEKVPAPAIKAGIPDWVVAEPSTGYRCSEAKRAQAWDCAYAYHPNQLRRAQRFHLDAVGRHGGLATVAVLGHDRFAELVWPTFLQPLSWDDFERLSMEYAE